MRAETLPSWQQERVLLMMALAVALAAWQVTSRSHTQYNVCILAGFLQHNQGLGTSMLRGKLLLRAHLRQLALAMAH